eukprot:CAMPEP_0174377792 /NCGR_PEP_ID=MMETSP0811_2-20130205/121660_1 /TAXON_ID=73025 ORGANISM="Eutreptiella gymnastica-like, Strain CCMP1594" /NCGR_SAMPLE_ID=MMETSP0811_2 /ASSEMBLY_ACC=CAM_ASM_000667 /LENGTH=489 /DNA_ID=CAMNT_0015529873 /DNA_START=726 /DNA_END=2191 /DNA_ORIENTATION=-
MIDFDELEELEALAEERDRLSSDQPICLRWVVDVSAWEPSDEEFDFLIDLVPSDNPQEVKKYRVRADRKRALVGRLLTHAAVATVLGIPYREISIGRTKGRKPFLCTPHSVDWAPNFNFNVSHEGRYVALATENLCVVGVDVAAPLSQRKRNQSVPEFFATLETVCSPRECNDIRKQGSEELQSGAFQRHWSLKEAFVKARGDGLAFDPLSRAEFTIGGPLDALEPRVCVDGQARPEWNFFLEERDGYWFSVSERDRLSSGQPICLRWLVDVSGWEPSDAEMDFLIDLVPSDNPQQVKKYRYRDDQKRSLVGRLLTHAAVATVLGIPYREISIGRTKGRKPFLCTPHNVDWAPNFNFNISHEGRYVALATENLCVVGVDVAAPLSERNQSVPQLFANLDTVCSPREWNDIRKQGSEEQQMGAFQRRWSLKEAFVKARGDGLAFEPLSRAEFTIDGPLSSLQPRVCVDGHARPEWKFFLEERDGYWFSVS